MIAIGLLLFVLAQDAAVTVTHGPYLQDVTHEGVVVCWRTNLEAEGVVAFGESEKNLQTRKGPAGVKHEIALTGLKAGARYIYRVGAIEGTFRTRPKGDVPFTFVVYGDGRSGHRTHRRLIPLIERTKPDLLLHTGDLVENGHRADQWKTFFEISAPLLRNVPLYPALGNHERNAPLYFDFFVLPGNERYYSFDYGPAHFLVLDSNRPWRTDPRQLEWMKKDLAATKKTYKFAIFHHPLVSSSPARYRRRDAEKMYEAWGKIFEEGGLTAAFQGHNHNYQRARKNGILYITTGGAGAPLYPTGPSLPETLFMKAAHHFVVVRVVPGRVPALEAVDAEGKIIDRFTP